MMTDARMMSIDELKTSLASIILRVLRALRGMMVSSLDGNGACGRRDCGMGVRSLFLVFLRGSS